MKLEQYYSELNQNIRATDEYSFKLLGLVPLSTLLIFVASLSKTDIIWREGFYFFGFLGALLIWSIFRWELRNIQKCKDLNTLKKEIELKNSSLDNTRNKDKKPVFLIWKIGKTESEVIVYSILILFWLSFPLLIKFNSFRLLYTNIARIDLLYILISSLFFLLHLITLKGLFNDK